MVTRHMAVDANTPDIKYRRAGSNITSVNKETYHLCHSRGRVTRDVTDRSDNREGPCQQDEDTVSAIRTIRRPAVLLNTYP